VGWVAQAVPFHRWASVAVTPRLLMLVNPTAVHADADGHDTPNRSPPLAPLGLGTGWTAQAVPFHRSTSGSGLVLV